MCQKYAVKQAGIDSAMPYVVIMVTHDSQGPLYVAWCHQEEAALRVARALNTMESIANIVQQAQECHQSSK